MPRLINQPIWYTQEYDDQVLKLVHDASRLFGQGETIVDGLSIVPFDYDDADIKNISNLKMRIKNWQPLRKEDFSFLTIPSLVSICALYIESALLIDDTIVNDAEEGSYSYLLAAALTPREESQIAVLEAELESFSHEQLNCIVRLLSLIELRCDVSATAARRALASFWNRYS